MRQSNTYILVFSAITTIVIGGLLALAALLLGPQQKKAIEVDTKQQILGAVMEIEEGGDILELYRKHISSFVVNYDGEKVEPKDKNGNVVSAENVSIEKEFDKAPEDRYYPVFIYHEEGSDEAAAYIFPVYGNGLWDNIWGFIALETDLETIRGARFAHAGETPGLGARITEIEVQNRFKGKKVYNDLGDLVSVSMMKGENNPTDRIDEHHVDGMSGATITANGVSKMLENYFSHYNAYIQVQKNQEITS